MKWNYQTVSSYLHLLKKITLVCEIKYTEQELIHLLKQKDKTAFEYLYEKYAASFYGIILNNLNQDEKSAGNILQEVFMQIWKSLEGYDNTKEVLFSWMFKILRLSVKDKIGIMKKISIQLINKNVVVVDK